MPIVVNSLPDQSEPHKRVGASSCGKNTKNRRHKKLAKLRGTLRVGDTFRPFTENGKFLFNNCPVIDEVMMCPAISHGEKLVLAFLMRRQGKKGDSFPSAKNVAEGIGTGERQAERFLRGLRQLRFVKVQSRRNPNNPMRNCSNLYEFVWHPLYGLEHKKIREMTREDLIGLVRSHPVTNDGSHPVTNDGLTPSQMSGKDHHHKDPPFKDLQDSIRKETTPKKADNRGNTKTKKQCTPIGEKPSKVLLKTIDDEKTKGATKRAPLENPVAEFSQRLAERAHKNPNTCAPIPLKHIFELVRADLEGCPIERFLALDDEKTTGTPANPVGYYRDLAQQCAAEWKIEKRNEAAAKLRELRELRKNPPRKPCSLGQCDGGGIYYDGPYTRFCTCEAGAKIHPKAREDFEISNAHIKYRLEAGLSARSSVEEWVAHRGDPLYDPTAFREKFLCERQQTERQSQTTCLPKPVVVPCPANNSKDYDLEAAKKNTLRSLMAELASRSPQQSALSATVGGPQEA